MKLPVILLSFIISFALGISTTLSAVYAHETEDIQATENIETTEDYDNYLPLPVEENVIDGNK